MRNETYYLALCYLNVIGVSVDKEKARSLFEKKTPIADSKYQLGFLYLEWIWGPKEETKGASLKTMKCWCES